jgi:epoxyqueuosine reductase
MVAKVCDHHVLHGTGVARRSCPEVCPWNSFASDTSEPAFLPRAGVDGASLIEMMGLTQEEFSRRFRGSAVKRTKRRGLLRNVAVALGNWGSPEAVPALVAALADEEPLVRGHAAWALGRIASREDCPPEVVSQVGEALMSRLFVEEDVWVREEMSLALSNWRRTAKYLGASGALRSVRMTRL